MKKVQKILAICIMLGLLVVSVAIPACAETPTAPAAAYVYNSPLSAGVSLHYSGSGWVEGGLVNLAVSVQLNTYDYVEYDVYIPSGDYRYALKFKNAGGSVAQFTDSNNRKSVSEYGVWQHVVVPVSNFSSNNIVVTQAYLGVTNNEVYIANLAFTKFLPAASYVYNSPLSAGVTLHYSGSGWVEGGLTNLAVSVQLNTYDYVEYDVYIPSGDYRYALKFKNAGGSVAQFTDSNNRKSVSEYGVWQHVVVPVSNFSSNNIVATQAYLGVTNNEVYIANLAFTKFLPVASYVYNSPLSAGVTLHYSGSGWAEGGLVNLASSVQLNTYDYVEYDVYIPSGDYRYALKFKNAGGSVAQFTDGSNRKSVSEYGVWQHVAVPVSNFSSNNIVATQAYIGITNNDVYIANLAFTKFAPEVNNVYYSPLNTGASMDNAGVNWSATGSVAFSAVDITPYDYVEFDIYLESATESAARVRPALRSSNGQIWQQTNYPYYDCNQWNHIVLSLSNSVFGGNANRQSINGIYFESSSGNVTYHLRNLCFTKATEDPCANGHTPSAAVVENSTPTGYDSVVYCSVCHTEISREHVVVVPGNLSVATQRKGDEARLVIKLTGEAEAIEAYEDITVDYSLDGTEYSVSLDALYDSFINEDEVVSAASLSCTYVAILEIGDVQGISTIVATASYTANGETVTGPTRTTNAERVYKSWK